MLLLIIRLHVLYISGHILCQPIWLCALCDLYWENRYMLQTCIDIYYITSDQMTACIVHIGTYIILAHLAVCIMQPVLGNRYTLQNLYRYILYHFRLYDCMYYTYRYIYYISPSGCVHYVACIGNRYTLQNLYRYILYHFRLYDCMYYTYRDIY